MNFKRRMMTDLRQAQIKFLLERLKSQLNFANTLKELNQNNLEVVENITKLETNIQDLQNKLKLEKLIDD